MRPPGEHFPFGPGFGRGRGFGPGAGRERFMRGRLNALILEVINERPRHGYEVMKAIEEKSYGFYAPSAGSVYPILQALEDRGLVTSSLEDGKKIYTITAEGKQELNESAETFASLRERLRERLGDMGRFRDLVTEMNQTMFFAIGKMREQGIDDAETIRRLRVAMVNFKGEVEEIFRERKERSV